MSGLSYLRCPGNRFNAGICKFGQDSIYVFGGTEEQGKDNETSDTNHSAIDVFNIGMFEWTTMPVDLRSPISQ